MITWHIIIMLFVYQCYVLLVYLLCALPGGVLASEMTFAIGPSGVFAFTLPVKQAPLKGEHARRFDFLMERFLNISL